VIIVHIKTIYILDEFQVISTRVGRGKERLEWFWDETCVLNGAQEWVQIVMSFVFSGSSPLFHFFQFFQSYLVNRISKGDHQNKMLPYICLYYTRMKRKPLGDLVQWKDLKAELKLATADKQNSFSAVLFLITR